jgi:hypothetical protein
LARDLVQRGDEAAHDDRREPEGELVDDAM